jgi:hypothetical protein
MSRPSGPDTSRARACSPYIFSLVCNLAGLPLQALTPFYTGIRRNAGCPDWLRLVLLRVGRTDSV